MHNFSLHFSHPWLLLLLIPAIALTLIPYFRLSKRYRKTRNRISSMVLHLLVMVLTISVLSGLVFKYDLTNDKNEIMLVVDLSKTEEQSQTSRDEFVKKVLQDGQYDNYKIGVVTFGFDQKYAVPLTTKVAGIYDRYKEADLPDTSATDIAAALTYAKNLFTYPETAKIVLVTDAKETDEEASTVIGSITAQGTRIDTAYIHSEYEGDDVQLTDVKLPDYHVSVDEECTISVTLQSKAATSVTIEMYDNGQLDSETGTQILDVVAGTHTIFFQHTFSLQGFHEIAFKLSTEEDLIDLNNQYNTYLYLEVFDKILILERNDKESEKLVSMLTSEEAAYKPDVLNLYTAENIPDTVDKLLAYDQIILNNISNADLINSNMPAAFDEMLKSYVYDYGGGLLTVGGDNEDGEANAYNRTDMRGTTYQDMLPVQAINYTPPLGVVVIIDRSGSMGSEDNDGIRYLDWARSGAAACLDAMTERDYFGLMALESDYEMILPLTPRSQEAKILAAIDSIQDTLGGTVFPGAIERAGQALRALKSVDKRHIIVVTDGGVPEDQRKDYEGLIKSYYETDEITMSVVVIGMKKDSDMDEDTPLEDIGESNLTDYQKMLRAVILGHGRLYPITEPLSDLVMLMREDLNVDEIKLVNDELFYPTVANLRSPLVSELERGGDGSAGNEEQNKNKLTVSLDGFYGVKKKEAADLILSGEYDVPIYAQWKYGNGMVGSFMCDLNGNRSQDFMSDANGQTFIFNVVKNLMPLKNIRPNELRVGLKEYNYINKLSVYTDVEEGQRIEGQLIDMSSDNKTAISLNKTTPEKERETANCFVTLALDASNNFSRSNFVVRESGVYKMVLTKYAADNSVISVYETYKTFSYSQEYDTFIEETETDFSGNLAELAENGNGKQIKDLQDPYEVFLGFKTDIPRAFDPRILFIILSIVFLLLDIAVRKFKFKWPHELYRQFKEKKSKK